MNFGKDAEMNPSTGFLYVDVGSVVSFNREPRTS